MPREEGKALTDLNGLLRIQFGGVTAGAVVENGVVVKTAPVLHKLRGQTLEEARLRYSRTEWLPDPVPEEMTTHWLLWDGNAVTIIWNADFAAVARELGRRVEGPYVLAEKSEGMNTAAMAEAVAKAAKQVGTQKSPFQDEQGQQGRMLGW
jgi:hypothetical protein